MYYVRYFPFGQQILLSPHVVLALEDLQGRGCNAARPTRCAQKQWLLRTGVRSNYQTRGGILISPRIPLLQRCVAFWCAWEAAGFQNWSKGVFVTMLVSLAGLVDIPGGDAQISCIQPP